MRILLQSCAVLGVLIAAPAFAQSGVPGGAQQVDQETACAAAYIVLAGSNSQQFPLADAASHANGLIQSHKARDPSDSVAAFQARVMAGAQMLKSALSAGTITMQGLTGAVQECNQLFPGG